MLFVSLFGTPGARRAVGTLNLAMDPIEHFIRGKATLSPEVLDRLAPELFGSNIMYDPQE